ncbi:hypothetical protein [Nocardioides sp. HB32]
MQARDADLAGEEFTGRLIGPVMELDAYTAREQQLAANKRRDAEREARAAEKAAKAAAVLPPCDPGCGPDEHVTDCPQTEVAA